MIQINKHHMSQNDVHTFALEVLDLIDELVKPEIKSGFIEKFWHYFTGYAKKKVLKKPVKEIENKLLIIHKKLNSRFKDLDTSIEINMMEKLNPGVKIPNVGQLGKVKNLTKINMQQAEALAKEIGF